jgi:uncharacterized protein (DUF2126 family)
MSSTYQRLTSSPRSAEHCPYDQAITGGKKPVRSNAENDVPGREASTRRVRSKEHSGHVSGTVAATHFMQSRDLAAVLLLEPEETSLVG